MRRRKETHAAEARARSVGEATRRKISSWRSLVRAGGGRSGSVASRQGRIRPALDAIRGEGRKGIEGLECGGGREDLGQILLQDIIIL